MSPYNQSSSATLSSDLQILAARQATWRVFWKFTTIFVCLLAYLFLEGIENAKESYDKAQTRPIVIVSDQYAKEYANKSDNDNAQKIAASLGSTECTSLSSGSREEPNRHYNARLLPICALEGLFESKSDIRQIIERKLMYQNFNDDDAIIDRLDKEILTEANHNKRALVLTEDAENSARARKLPDLSKEEMWIHEALNDHAFTSQLSEQANAKARQKELEDWIQNEWTKLPESERYASEAEIGNWRDTLARMRYSSTAPLGTRELIILHNAIVEEQREYDTRLKPLKDARQDIDEEAQLQITTVYEKLKPTLSKLIAGAPGAPKDYAKTNLGLFSFDPRPVLDAKNGTHVVYQIVRLALMMVLGLGLIFLMVFLIRLVPPISRGTDQFVERAGEFFKRSDAGGPQLAKTLLMTVSAVGIGAAVAVGSTVVGLTLATGDPGYVASQDKRDDQGGSKGKERNGKTDEGSDDERGPEGAIGPPGPAGGPGSQVDLHEVKLVPPIVYPSPITVSGPATVTLNKDSITTITDAITKFQSSSIDLRVTDIVKKEIERLKVNNPNPPKTSDCCSPDLVPRIEALEAWQKNSSQTFVLNLDALANNLRSTKETVEKLQAADLERVQNSGGRGLVTRGKQFLQGDKYMVTPRTVEALKLLMRKPARDCDSTTPPGTNAAAKKCCDEKPADKSYCPNPIVEAILTQLSNMVADPPQSESNFMKELRNIAKARGDVIDKTIDQWKSTILKYARTAY